MSTPPDAPCVGVDLGGTKIAAALVGADGACGPVTTLATPRTGGPGALVNAIVELVAVVVDGEPAAAVGIGTAGAVDRDRGVVVSATHTLPGWAGTHVADLVARGLRRRRHDVHVAVLNDVDAHALGEARHGAATGAANVLVVAAGTGIGGAIVLDGHLLRGAHYMAGEMGHMPVPGAEGLRCPCGREGHLEAIASGAGLAALHRSLSDPAASGPAPPGLTGRDVVALAAAGDPVAQESLRRSAEALGRGIAGIVTVLDPEIVLLTGGLAGAGPQWWAAVESGMRSTLVDHLADVPLRPGALGTAAAVVGAAAAARDLSTPAPPMPGPAEAATSTSKEPSERRRV